MLSELAPNLYFSGNSLTRDLADDLNSFHSIGSAEEVWERTVETIARIPEIITTWILESTELFQRVFELMGISLSITIEKNNIDLLSKIAILEKGFPTN
ncbi:MAG: hypothetical protein ACO1NV_06855 [Leptospira bouyouniensis]|uniref:Uncharacterized protein n=1 Tax=Leptospira bouyouniensis TaxID=2484911 RepID=A0ABY2L9L9_9LEPT|nr:hypothetical protein [Leptospira bouyouniensis]TGK52818.1 hypothetical protein EHQ10_03450 [Leptospira bouyouniensis]